MLTAVILVVNFLLGCLAGAVAGTYARNIYLERKEDAEFEARYRAHMHG